MKVLLVEDVRRLGWLGDVVEVNNGYARNYLLPLGLAREATDTNIKSIAKEKAKRGEVRLAERKQIEQACAAVDGAEAVIAAKANEQGHLFGSVSEKEIAENLRAQGFTVANEIVRLSEHIKEVGAHEVELKFDNDLTAKVNVVVVAEGVEGQTGPDLSGEGDAEQEVESEQTDKDE
jgi:large subunit ribosomal protein L9